MRGEKNCVELFTRAAAASPERTALWFGPSEHLSFAELRSLAARAQSEFRGQGIRAGDSVLLGLEPCAELYAAILALMGLDVTLLIVEPWLPLHRIEHVLNEMKPRAFLTGWRGKLWGLRTPGIRAIPKWVTPAQLRAGSAAEFVVDPRDPSARVIVTFSSGTSGHPKGVVRTDHFMTEMHYLLTENETRDRFDGPDLTIFANLALFRLGTGRGVVFVRSGWKEKDLQKITALPKELQPETLTCGPAFLARLLQVRERRGGFGGLKNIYLGGALTDCSLLEQGIKALPQASWHHVYGSSDAEPITIADARECLARSRERGHFQLLNVGSPLPFVRSDLTGGQLWVAGPNVCPEYIDSPEENRLIKRRGDDGTLWHCIGDRVEADEKGWWFLGKSSQRRDEFFLEQNSYSMLGHSRAMFHRGAGGEGVFIGEKVVSHQAELRRRFPEISRVQEARIYRDRRHLARIDRVKTVKKAGLR